MELRGLFGFYSLLLMLRDPGTFVSWLLMLACFGDFLSFFYIGMRLGWLLRRSRLQAGCIGTKPTGLQNAKGRGVRLGKRLLRRSLCGRPMTQQRLLLRLHFDVSSPRGSTRAVVPRAARAYKWLRFVLSTHAGVAHADVSGPERDELMPGVLRRCPACASKMD